MTSLTVIVADLPEGNNSTGNKAESSLSWGACFKIRNVTLTIYQFKLQYGTPLFLLRFSEVFFTLLSFFHVINKKKYKFKHFLIRFKAVKIVGLFDTIFYI